MDLLEIEVLAVADTGVAVPITGTVADVARESVSISTSSRCLIFFMLMAPYHL